jgi:hypothetical protein
MYSKINLVCLFTLMVFYPVNSQTIDTIQIERSIEIPNKSVIDLDSYFNEDYKLIAYGSSSGDDTGDTLVIFDYKNDLILSKIKGTGWKYIIRFIDNDHLLYLNTTSHIVYSVANLSDPQIHNLIVKQGDDFLYSFAISKDKSRIATRIYREPGINFVRFYDYNSAADTASLIDTFAISAIDYETQLTISDDNKYIALSKGYDKDSVILINTVTKEVDEIATTERLGTYSPVFFSKDGVMKLAVSGGYANGGVDIIDVAGKSIDIPVPVFANYNYSIAIDSSQRYLVCGGYNKEFRLLDMKDNLFTKIGEGVTPEIIYKVDFTDDNQYVLIGSGWGHGKLDIYKIIYKPETNGFLELKSDYKFYPIPVSDILKIDGLNSNYIAKVLTMNGVQVFKSELLNGLLDLNNIPAGTYILKIITDDGKHFVTKIIKK